ALEHRRYVAQAPLARFRAFGALQPIDVLSAVRKRQLLEAARSLRIGGEHLGEVVWQLHLTGSSIELEANLDRLTPGEAGLDGDVAAETDQVAATIDGNACAVLDAMHGRDYRRAFAATEALDNRRWNVHEEVRAAPFDSGAHLGHGRP